MNTVNAIQLLYRVRCTFTFTFTLSDAPRITLAPSDQRVLDNNVVSFLCKASGNPAPEVFWRKSGKRMSNSRHRYSTLNMPHGSVLRIDPAKAKRDDGTVECVADNGIGEAVATATLEVYAEGHGKTAEIYSLLLFARLCLLFPVFIRLFCHFVQDGWSLNRRYQRSVPGHYVESAQQAEICNRWILDQSAIE